MQTFYSWLGSQSGISLLVALIALVGVLSTTAWNNKAADKRRRDDQAAEEARRKADDDRREHERLEQLKREDWARQRRVVATCIREINRAAGVVNERTAEEHLVRRSTLDQIKLVKAIGLNQFYVEATSQLNLLEIEVTQPHVRAQVSELWEQLIRDYKPFMETRNQGGQSWISAAYEMPPLSDAALRGIRALTIVTRLALLEEPEHMATQPVKPVVLEGS